MLLCPNNPRGPRPRISSCIYDMCLEEAGARTYVVPEFGDLDSLLLHHPHIFPRSSRCLLLSTLSISLLSRLCVRIALPFGRGRIGDHGRSFSLQAARGHDVLEDRERSDVTTGGGSHAKHRDSCFLNSSGPGKLRLRLLRCFVPRRGRIAGFWHSLKVWAGVYTQDLGGSGQRKHATTSAVAHSLTSLTLALGLS